MSTESVVRHHIQALAEGDLDAIMADYSQISVLLTNDNVIEGLDGIRTVFAGAVANGGFVVSMQHEVYHDDAAYITRKLPGVITLGTDTFIVKEETIVLQTNALVMEPAS